MRRVGRGAEVQRTGEGPRASRGRPKNRGEEEGCEVRGARIGEWNFRACVFGAAG